MTLKLYKNRFNKLIWLLRRKWIVLTEKRKEGELLFDWESNPYMRTDLIQAVIKAYPPKAYLEIGCQADKNFKDVQAPLKVGVDPAAGGTHRMTSDVFFAQNKDGFDVIFIDGLHTYEQARRDVINSLKCLNPGGIILIHDILPASWERERVPRAYPIWNGTVWKVAYELLERFGDRFAVVKANHGVGVIFLDEKSSKPFIDKDFLENDRKKFDDFARDNKRFHLVSVGHIGEFLAKRRWSANFE